MKDIKKIILGILLLVGLQFGLFGCFIPVGGRGGRGDNWSHDGRWMDGGRGGFGEVHPGGFRR
jgi:hypothetical protein